VLQIAKKKKKGNRKGQRLISTLTYCCNVGASSAVSDVNHYVIRELLDYIFSVLKACVRRWEIEVSQARSCQQSSTLKTETARSSELSVSFSPSPTSSHCILVALRMPEPIRHVMMERTCSKRKLCTDRVLRPDRSEQNAQWIWSSPLTEIRVVGCIWVITELSLHYVTLPPWICNHYPTTAHSSHAAKRSSVKMRPVCAVQMIMAGNNGLRCRGI
jgi:hypothetical protein